MASTRCHTALTPSTWPSEHLRVSRASLGSFVIGRIDTGISWIRSHEEARLKVQQAQLAEKLAARNPEEAGEEDEQPVSTCVEIKNFTARSC